MVIEVMENRVGEPIPPMTAHAVSVSLPTWSANVSYEEGHAWVIERMQTGYPRFFIHKSVTRLANELMKLYGMPGEQAMVFPSYAVAVRCASYIRCQFQVLEPQKVRIFSLIPKSHHQNGSDEHVISPRISVVFFHQDVFAVAKQFWQHTGEGVSSRRAEYCSRILEEGLLVVQPEGAPTARACKGPKRYRRNASMDSATEGNTGTQLPTPCQTPNGVPEDNEHRQFIEERFGRNLDISLALKSKLAIRRRIAGSLIGKPGMNGALGTVTDHNRTRRNPCTCEDDVYLYPTGMSAIFNSHRTLLETRGRLKSIIYGFPYVDTLKIVEKFGPGCLFYGNGSAEDLDNLQSRLEGGERYLALFCEFPSNPLLKSPELSRIRTLADRFDFAVVVDETVGNFLNVNVLPYADIIVSSLTKVFSGDSNVMGGSAILNPDGRYYQQLKLAWADSYEDNLWAEDAIYLERNSRDFASRIKRININAEAVCNVLREHPKVKEVHYPKCSPTRAFYDICRLPNGGYGGLLSATFHSVDDAAVFYDSIDTAKGPSLGTNFTLSSPYVILAHYNELDWASQYGVEVNLVRFSIGLEDTDDLVSVFRRALEAI